MNGVADVEMLFFGVVFVDEHVVVFLERAALKEVEAAAHFAELSEVEAGDGVEAGQRLDDGACRYDNMGLLGQHRNQLVGHGR